MGLSAQPYIHLVGHRTLKLPQLDFQDTPSPSFSIKVFVLKVVSYTLNSSLKTLYEKTTRPTRITSSTILLDTATSPHSPRPELSNMASIDNTSCCNTILYFQSTIDLRTLPLSMRPSWRQPRVLQILVTSAIQDSNDSTTHEYVVAKSNHYPKLQPSKTLSMQSVSPDSPQPSTPRLSKSNNRPTRVQNQHPYMRGTTATLSPH